MTDQPFVGLRRSADLVPRDEPGDNPALLARIGDEIREGGPMTFARFMDVALYDPEHGYYASGARGPGRTGDFLTAPESHPIFGWTIARQLEEVWEALGHPDPFTIREFGAGTGALAAAIVDGLERSGSSLRTALRYRIAERSPDRERQVADRLAAVGAREALEPDDGGPIVGAILANEVLDALPVHRVVGLADGRIAERLVGLDPSGALTAVDATPTTAGLVQRLDDEGVVLAAGQIAEVCLGLDGWFAEAAGGLERGLVLAIDYGHPGTALYEPSRGSLLRAYVHHRVHDDPFRNVGRQDLTAHVDLTAAIAAAGRTGLQHLGTTTQAEFLAGLGVGDLLVGLQDGPAADLEGYLAARSAVVRLLDPGATGRFAVMAFGRDLPLDPPLTGLRYRMGSR